ncbi:hypothetical protein [Mucilaginibacter sp.]|jgi:lambda repressor-like predicted transcriptional regulator|uniref:hypothetical protein n=1 Tax=Mucilaginibacter sp. TaxID=1882438 RepID=UPI0025E39972|nr:hypothetical protein [Mucilaginibacter sp.]
MDKHYGQTVEAVIRKKGYSISEIAHLAHVNRRSVYNWFNQKYLKTEIIFSLGLLLKHDFSVEFPDLFTKKDFQEIYNYQEPNPDDLILKDTITHHVWKNRYIELLEQYNQLKLTHPHISEYLERKKLGLDG